MKKDKKIRSNGPSMKLLQMKEIKIKMLKTNKALKKSIKRAYLIIWLPARNPGKFAIIIYPPIWLAPIFYTIKKGCFETNCLQNSLGT